MKEFFKKIKRLILVGIQKEKKLLRWNKNFHILT